MFKNSLRPIARSTRTSLQAQARSVRFAGSSSSPKSSSNGLIVPLGMGAILVGGIAYYYVPLTHDLGDRADDAAKGKAKPDTLTAMSSQHVSKSVLDQHSLKEPLHQRAGSTDAAAPPKGGVIPDVVETKASEANEPAQTAFNEETGEINWDCPCLGGMADGPCGEDFKAAFSCFVYSDKEPKGVECVDKFKNMQDCFRQHPDIYGEEIDDDEEELSEEQKRDVDPRPQYQKDKKPEAVKRTPPPDSPVHSANHDNSVKGVAKLVPTKQRSDKGSEGGTPPIGEGTANEAGRQKGLARDS